ncbi:MAG: hypothetical protein ACKV2Q_33010 [Planctomycetaceae bacterium]
MDSKKANRPMAEERERRAKDIVEDSKRWLDIESRLEDWDQFFRSAMLPFLDPAYPYRDPYGALKADAPQIAQVAREAVVSLMQAKSGIAGNNIRGVVVTLLDMAFSACQMFYLDSEGDANIRDKAREILDIGRRLANESTATEAERTAKQIRSEVDTILRGSPVKMSSTSARKALARWSHFTDGTPMVSLRTINEAFARDGKRKPKERKPKNQ